MGIHSSCWAGNGVSGKESGGRLPGTASPGSRAAEQPRSFLKPKCSSCPQRCIKEPRQRPRAERGNVNSLKRCLWQRVGNGRRESCSCFLLFQIPKVFQNPRPPGFFLESGAAREVPAGHHEGHRAETSAPSVALLSQQPG